MSLLSERWYGVPEDVDEELIRVHWRKSRTTKGRQYQEETEAGEESGRTGGQELSCPPPVFPDGRFQREEQKGDRRGTLVLRYTCWLDVFSHSPLEVLSPLRCC